MKYLIAAFLIAIPCIAIADVYVITAPDKTVYSISEQNDALVPAGYTKDVIKNKGIQSLQLGDDLTLYSYAGKKFTLDGVKVANKNKIAQDSVVAIEAKKTAKASAISKLKALGLTDDEISVLIQ